MTAGRYSIGGVDLPDNAIVTSGDGETLNLSLIRAVEADEWDVTGDGKAVPAELVIQFTVEGTTETAASAQVALYWGLALADTQIDREDRAYRRILRAKSCVVAHSAGDGTQQQVTLTLLPRESRWKIKDSTATRLF